MILKISARELRELLSSGSVPAKGVLGAVAHPVGDGRTKSTMAAGSDHDVDKKRIETLESVADFNGRAFRRGAGVFAKDTTDWARWVRRPSDLMGGFPHDCTAAMFGRRFSEAFDAWLDAFDCVLRSLPGGEVGRRMLDMESYAVTDTDAVVRVYRLEGGLRRGGPFHEHRVHLKPLCVLGSGCRDYVDGVVAEEVDDLVRGLGSALGFDDSQMAGVRALVALEERPRFYGSDGRAGVSADGKAGPDFGSRDADVQDYDIDDDRHVEGVGEDGEEDIGVRPARAGIAGRRGDEVVKKGDDEAVKKGRAVRFVRGPKSGYDAAVHAGCVYYAYDKEEIIVNGETYACKAFVSRRETMAHKAAEMIRVWLDGLDRWARARHKERCSAHEYGMSFSVFPSAGGVRLMCHDMDHSFGKATEYAVYDRWCPLPDGADADATDYAVLMCVMMASHMSGFEQWMDIEGFLRRDGATPFDARVLEALEGREGQGCGEDGDVEDEDE